MAGRGALVVKVCGVTSAKQAAACAALGVDLVGVNFVPASPRRVDAAGARAIARAVRGRARVVGVVAMTGEAELRRLLDEAELDLVQLCGEPGESAAALEALGSRAFQVVRIATEADVEAALRVQGDVLLVDAKVEGVLGGSGVRVPTALAAELARARPVLLAGGLRPDDVAEAVRAVRPWGVDVASGVESEPRVKDLAKVEAFVRAARAA